MSELSKKILKIKSYLKIFGMKIIKFLGDIIPFLNRLTIKLDKKIDHLKNIISGLAKKL